MNFVQAAFLVFFFNIKYCGAHSILVSPQSFSRRACTGLCGPCRLANRRNPGILANYYPGGPVAASFRRGQNTSIAYTRNNHAPGGFLRLSLVPLESMMDKETHSRNAFHYSCWGANDRVATPEEIKKDRFNYSFTGSDGSGHPHGVGYYIAHVTIPKCVPNGYYVLGYVWFGGMSGTWAGTSPQIPLSSSHFADFWSCSWIQIEGSDPVEENCNSVFNNDMNVISNEGCMAHNDRPGVCASGPCNGLIGTYQLPAKFKNGPPDPMTRDYFLNDSTPEETTEESLESSSNMTSNVTENRNILSCA